MVLGGNCYLIPFNGGIATPVCALARNDSVYFVDNNLSNWFFLPPGAVEELPCSGKEKQGAEELLQKGGVYPKQGKKRGGQAPGEDGGEYFPEGNTLPAAQEGGEDGPGQKEEQIDAAGLAGVHALYQGQPQNQQASAPRAQPREESQRRCHCQRNQEV